MTNYVVSGNKKIRRPKRAQLHGLTVYIHHHYYDFPLTCSELQILKFFQYIYGKNNMENTDKFR
mgnify:CR=1 FL=1